MTSATNRSRQRPTLHGALAAGIILLTLAPGAPVSTSESHPLADALGLGAPGEAPAARVEQEIERARTADWSQPALAWRESEDQGMPPGRQSAGWRYRTPQPDLELVVTARPGRIEARRVGAPGPLWRYDGEEVDLNRPPPVSFANETSRRFLLVEPGAALHIFDLLRGPLCTIALADRVRVRQERLVDRPFFAPDERSLVYVLDGALRRLDLEGCASRNLTVVALPEPEEGYSPPQCHCLLGAKNGEFAWTDSRYASDGLRPASRVARLWRIGADSADLLLELHPAPTDSCWCEPLRALDLWGPIEKAGSE